ncbi:desulfoferrodoxin [Martelella alba]|uniref:Desulfoferrodoxin n=2 Tax=Martelella alba TaxID=2590451 RepID=A0ABY2SNG7_9HYPH|nr:desulfoferrodoxin [Martelella alba]
MLIEPQAAPGSAAPDCCATPMQALAAQNADAPGAHDHRVAMQVFGGFDANALTVSVGETPHPTEAAHRILWLYLYTFQGGQLKFLSPGEPANVTFPLAGKDAYVYCDRRICKGRRCKFNCKRGFRVFAYCSRDGLWLSAF